jgi:hypothetical protein
MLALAAAASLESFHKWTRAARRPIVRRAMAAATRRAPSYYGLGWLSALFRAAFAEQPTISQGRYLACNLAAGLVLLLIAGLMLSDPKLGSSGSELGLGAGGLALSAGVLVQRIRPSALSPLLAVHGVIFSLLASALTFTSVRWAFLAPPKSPFRYAPGLILVLTTYSAMLIGVFGPWQRSSRRMRTVAVWLGVFLEICVLASLLVRASK